MSVNLFLLVCVILMAIPVTILALCPHVANEIFNTGPENEHQIRWSKAGAPGEASVYYNTTDHVYEVWEYRNHPSPDYPYDYYWTKVNTFSKKYDAINYAKEKNKTVKFPTEYLRGRIY